MSGASFTAGTSSTFRITFAPNAVPEPGSIALLGLGFVAIGSTRFGRRRGSATAAAAA